VQNCRLGSDIIQDLQNLSHSSENTPFPIYNVNKYEEKLLTRLIGQEKLTVMFCGYCPVSSLKRQTLKRRFSKLSRACSSVSVRLLTLKSFPVQVHTNSEQSNNGVNTILRSRSGMSRKTRKPKLRHEQCVNTILR
jgi:hypothetical protein